MLNQAAMIVSTPYIISYIYIERESLHACGKVSDNGQREAGCGMSVVVAYSYFKGFNCM